MKQARNERQSKKENRSIERKETEKNKLDNSEGMKQMKEIKADRER
jgi:hypothetical protein